jgi:diamine N-acetyltransferase
MGGSPSLPQDGPTLLTGSLKDIIDSQQICADSTALWYDSIMSGALERFEMSDCIELVEVTGENWRDVADLTVAEGQQEFVAQPCHYLCLCAYGGLWKPLAIRRDGVVVGFVMWAVDEEDGSCWLGGILVDREHQGRGVGRSAVTKAMERLAGQIGCEEFALSYSPGNAVARHLYTSMGFVETGEREGEEIVARLRRSRA